jgi:hypothetical protein
MVDNQLSFDFESPRDESGYAALEAGREAEMRQLAERFGIAIGQRVRVTLRDIDAEFEGKLIVDELLPPTSRHAPLRLRIGLTAFDFADIESCIVLDGA